MKRTQVVKLSDREVSISNLPLRKYAELLKSLNNIPQYLNKFTEVSEETIASEISVIIGECLPDFINALHISTGIKKEEIEEMPLDDVVSLTIAVIDVNNFAEVVSKVKKAAARSKK